MRGLSPIVSTIILIVAAIIGGTIAYQYFVSTMSSLTSKPLITIDQASLFDNKILFVSISKYTKASQISIKGIRILCGENVIDITADNPNLKINGTTIIYTSSTPICSSGNVLVAVLYSDGSSTHQTEPVRPLQQ